MEFEIREKGWIWKLGSFLKLDKNYTLIGTKILYKPKGATPSKALLKHESIHVQQIKEVGLLKYYLLYLFCFPFFFNKWRWKWEYEAYTKGSKWSEEQTKRILRSSMYGWLKHK